MLTCQISQEELPFMCVLTMPLFIHVNLLSRNYWLLEPLLTSKAQQTEHSPIAVSMLGQHWRQWANIEAASAEFPGFAGGYHLDVYGHFFASVHN